MNTPITTVDPVREHTRGDDAIATLDDFGRAATGPLAGLVIADFGRVLAGPYCTMLLADLGATVIKVESPTGDDTRAWKPPMYDEKSTYYLSINRNKRSIVLDFANPADLAVAKDIAARADVVIENFKSGGLAQFGLDYDSVAQTNENVVYASITGFGSAGGAALPGYDLLVQGLSGLMSITGGTDTQGFRCGVSMFDVMTGLHATIGILAALKEREHSGKGQRLEVNLMSSALSGMVNATAGYVLSGTVPSRLGNEHASLFPYGPFPTGDGELIIAIGNDRQFRTLCAALGDAALADDARFTTAHARCDHREILRPRLIELLSQRNAEEWFEVLTAAKLPCAPINDVAGGIKFAESIGLEPVVEVGSAGATMPGIRNPIRYSRTPASYDLAPPTLDGDRVDILGWLEQTRPRQSATESAPQPALVGSHGKDFS